MSDAASGLKQWSVKYRPKSLDRLLAPGPARAQIARILQSPKDAHAVLIVGPSGVGKTTAARLIAHSVAKGATQDIDERNLGGDRGIDAARDIVQAARYLPSVKGGRRVFILDEVHALTGPAASSVLKPLEEPHAHVMWILCTDQPEKILPSIINRCVVIRLDYPDPRDLKKLLLGVLKRENALQTKPLKVRAKLCAAVAEAAGNVPRQALQILQTAVASSGEYKNVKELIAHAVNGSASPQFDMNRAVARVIMALLLAGQGRTTLKSLLAVLAQQDSHVFLGRCVATVTATLIEAATGERQPGAYLVIDGMRKVGAKLDLGHLMIVHEYLTMAQGRAVSFMVDQKALAISACLAAYRKLDGKVRVE